MKAETFLHNEYGITERLANLDLETENGIRNHYLTSLMEIYAEEEIKKFLKFNKDDIVRFGITKVIDNFDIFFNNYKENNK